jgi:hypothetical protein
MIRARYLADLLLVDGDPLADPSVHEDRARIALVLKGGAAYAPCDGPPHVRRLAPAELGLFGGRPEMSVPR